MENTVEEYKKDFRPEMLELIVQISWCWEKGNSNFSTLGNYYIAEARIGSALNVKSGELIESRGINDRIVWLSPKKMFGFKYGYKFKKGNMYRILVREHTKNNGTFNKYYLEQVLEKDINEPRLDARYNFESRFEEQVADLVVLIRREIIGWPVVANYRNPRVDFIASIDNETNKLDQSQGTLTWMEKDSKSKLKYNFDKMGAYHVRARKNKENNRSYLLVDVLNKIDDKRFDNVKEEYLKPIIIRSEFGEFQLDRDYDRFEGKTDYLDEKCSVTMYVNRGETTADIQLNKLREIMKDLADWDNRLKRYTSQEMLDLANDWCEDEIEITEEQFIQRIGVPGIVIHPDGKVEAWFESDGMFTDHAVVVEIDKNGNFGEVNLEG